MKRIGTIILTVIVLFPLTGWVMPSAGTTISQANASATVAIRDASIKDNLKRFYEQKVVWAECGKQIFCGGILVPTNWANPSAGDLFLAVAYRAADIAKPLGSVIFNPGGPGASGYDYILNSVDSLGTEKLRSQFNIVGFDPRGVGSSEPKIKCFDAAKTDEMLYGGSGFSLGSAQDLKAARSLSAQFAAACAKNTGPALAHVDTVSVARDMDVLRSVTGESKLNYLGFSYGSLLGETYAALYPTKIAHMVLDGVVDPTMSVSEQNHLQLKGFDKALRNYLANCLSTADCPFSGTVPQALEKIKSFLRALETKPLPTKDGRQLTFTGALTGLILPLYSETLWPYLSQAFVEAFNKGEGTIFIALADAYNSRDSSGKYTTNLLEANTAIGCLDARVPSDNASMAKQNKLMLATSSTLGRYWQFGGFSCERWPYPVVAHPKSYSAKGSAPILVIGTTGDPATPYSQAVSVATKILSNGHLVTYKGEGHTAYGRSNECVANTVDNYFITNAVPKQDPDC